MATPDQELPPAPQWTGHALEWGIGSLVIGLLVLLAIPLGVVSAALGLGMYVGGGGLLSVDNIGEIYIGIEVVAGFFMFTAALGLWFGIRGVRHARARGLPAGVAATGVVLCSILVVGIGAVIGAVIANHLGTMENIRGRGPFPERGPLPRRGPGL